MTKFDTQKYRFCMKLSQEQYDRMCNNMLIKYVENSTPVLWHQMAMDWNYDNCNTFFDWLINNRETDRATALMIYWMSAPRLSKQYANRAEVEEKESWYLDDFDFIEALEDKLLSNFFVNSNFSYDPKHEHTGTDWTAEYLDKKTVRDIPTQLFEPLVGQIVPEPLNFIEGYPEDLMNEINQLGEENEIC